MSVSESCVPKPRCCSKYGNVSSTFAKPEHSDSVIQRVTTVKDAIGMPNAPIVVAIILLVPSTVPDTRRRRIACRKTEYLSPLSEKAV